LELNIIKAVIILDESVENMRVIDIDLYTYNGKSFSYPSKRIVDEINVQIKKDKLNKEQIRCLAAQKNHLTVENVTFFQ
jgi:hypothetical protein